MSNKRKDKAEIEALRLELEYKVTHILEYSNKVISEGVTEKDLAYLDTFDAKVKLESELFKQLCKKYVLLYKESPMAVPLN